MTLKKNTTTTTSGKVQQSHGCLKWMKAVAYHQQMTRNGVLAVSIRTGQQSTLSLQLKKMLLKNNNKEF